MMKKTKTPTSPRMHWLPVIHAKGSLASLPSAIRKEWENTTDSAAASRTASKLLARWPLSVVEGGNDLFVLAPAGSGTATGLRHRYAVPALAQNFCCSPTADRAEESLAYPWLNAAGEQHRPLTHIGSAGKLARMVRNA